MANVICGPEIRLTAAAALSAGARVKLDSSLKAALASATEPAIGYTSQAAAEGTPVLVRLIHGDVFVACANEAQAVGDLLYAAADGRLTKTDPHSAIPVGYAFSTAAGQDSQVQVIPCDQVAVTAAS